MDASVTDSRKRRLVIAGLRGSSGKSVLSLGLVRGWSGRGVAVSPFKKGPDYIDSHWLRLASGRNCLNLDVYLNGEANVRRSFIQGSENGEIAVIEGNRGLFDGMDRLGTYSTAELARLIDAPVILIIDCTKTTRTAAAFVAGCKAMDPGLKIGGVVLNMVANERQGKTIRQCVENEVGIPVVGVIPRLRDFPFPERHLGLVMPAEHEAAVEAVDAAAELVAKYVDLDRLWDIASDAPELIFDPFIEARPTTRTGSVKIGIIHDEAFSFYYTENIDQLEREGAELIYMDSIRDEKLPEVDALYIGGGFPETLAEKLADNVSFRLSLCEAAKSGLPIYAECGGAMYLGESILYKNTVYPMVGALPITYELRAKPQGHGYTALEVVEENPFYPVGKKIRGHEFHYSRVLSWKRENLALTLRNDRGRGFDGAHDGVSAGNILALYSHILDLYGGAGWARAMIGAASRYAACRKEGVVAAGRIRVLSETDRDNSGELTYGPSSV